jgi:hypothetical protein
VLKHAGVVIGLLAGFAYVELWLIIYRFYTVFDMTPQDAGLRGIQALESIGIETLVLTGIFLLTLGCTMVAYIGIIDMMIHWTRRRITAAVMRKDPRAYAIARLSDAGLTKTEIARANVGDLWSDIDASALPKRHTLGQSGIWAGIRRVGFQGLQVGLLARWRYTSLLDPPIRAALISHIDKRQDGPLLLGDTGKRMSTREVFSLLKDLDREGRGLPPSPIRRRWSTLLIKGVLILELVLALLLMSIIQGGAQDYGVKLWSGGEPVSSFKGIGLIRGEYAAITSANGTNAGQSLVDRPCLLYLATSDAEAFLFDVETKELVRAPASSIMVHIRTGKPNNCLVGRPVSLSWAPGSAPTSFTAKDRRCLTYTQGAGETVWVVDKLNHETLSYPSAAVTVTAAPRPYACPIVGFS